MDKRNFKLYLSQLRDLVEDSVFKSHKVRKELKGLTWTYVNRFDSGELFDKYGLKSGENHFLTLCNN